MLLAAVKAKGAVLGSCSHSAECSVTVLLSSKEATSAAVSHSGHTVLGGFQQTGQVWPRAIRMEQGWSLWCRRSGLGNLASFGLEEVEEQGSKASHCLWWGCSQDRERCF